MTWRALFAKSAPADHTAASWSTHGPTAQSASTAMNLSLFVTALDDSVRSHLYESPWTCQALLRALSPLAQQYVIRLLYIDTPIAEAVVDSWVKPEFKSSHNAALTALRRLSLFSKTTDKSGRPAYALHNTFRAKLRLALSGRGVKTQQVNALVLQDLPAQEEIAAFARSQWESLLQLLLNPAKGPPELPAPLKRKAEALPVRQLLESAGLIGKGPDGAPLALTAEGFRFSLLDTYSQLWTLLKQYISSAQRTSGSELSSALSFLMQLGFRRVGQPYPFDALTQLEQRIAAHMAQLGLLCTFVAHEYDKAPYFCPTPLAGSLCGGYVAGTASWEVMGGYIIVETNYRVYAYTSSAIQTQILGQFCHTDCVLPNLYVGTLTRESVHRALARGMTAQQVISFLQQHAHPHVAKRVPVVPEVVADQIRLWEAETQRVRTEPGVIYAEFETQELYTASKDFAAQMGVLLWESTSQSVHKMYAVTQQGHALVKDHIKMLKAQAGLLV